MTIYVTFVFVYKIQIVNYEGKKISRSISVSFIEKKTISYILSFHNPY